MMNLNCILLVDDDMVNNYLNEKLLKSLEVCANIRITQNGEEALLYLARHGSPYDYNYPDLIMLDYNMPKMQGNEFMELFNQINSCHRHRSRIIVLTAFLDDTAKKQLIELGVEEFIEKPLTKEKLEEAFRKIRFETD
jgi:CheY-like chemotaxis protein